MATITSEKNVKVKSKIQTEYKELFVKADAIAVSSALRLIAINEEIAVLEAEKTAIKSIVSDIGRYNLGTSK